jgi:hypothetical protein
MKYFLDCLSPPPPWEGQALRDLGWDALNVYIGGPFLTGHTPWPFHSVEALAALGFTFVPLYVGQQLVPGRSDLQGAMTYDQGRFDGTDATVRTGACGFDRGTILGFDLEAGSWEANPAGVREYVRGAAEVINEAGHQFLLYCDRTTADGLGADRQLVDVSWCSWPRFNGSWYQRAPVGQFNPADPPDPWDAWQFGFGGWINGRNYDYNSARDDFPFAAFGG